MRSIPLPPSAHGNELLLSVSGAFCEAHQAMQDAIAHGGDDSPEAAQAASNLINLAVHYMTRAQGPAVLLEADEAEGLRQLRRQLWRFAGDTAAQTIERRGETLEPLNLGALAPHQETP